MSEIDRRRFVAGAAATAAFTIVPRHVLGGQAFVAPSDKITVGYIGCGTRGLIELMGMLPLPDLQVVAVCDPVSDSNEYIEFGSGGVLRSIRNFLDNRNWRGGAALPGAPGGRDVGKEIAEAYYAARGAPSSYKGVTAYSDFRELLDKEKIDAVKIMTPDHLHATIAIAAMNKGKHTVLHKPLANRLHEAKRLFEVARETKVATHFMAYGRDAEMTAQTMTLLRDGAIGALREIHNWTNRPVWPQYQSLPADRPPIPKDFDWQVWLGPAVDRPYHPNYTHTVFRGWYEFGGGSIADMGHYSMWPLFTALELPSPTIVEATISHPYEVKGCSATRINNDFAFPQSSATRFRFPAHGAWPEIDFYWYDGGMRPPRPRELDDDKKNMPASGMLLIGDKGKILDGRLIPESKMRAYPDIPPSATVGRGFPAAPGAMAGASEASGGGRGGAGGRGGPAVGGGRGGAKPWTNPLGVNGFGGISDLGDWIKSCRGGKQSPGNFLNAIQITDAVNLAAIAYRSGEVLAYDPVNMTVKDASSLVRKYMTREYRTGWEL
jgi:hypothetical protein